MKESLDEYYSFSISKDTQGSFINAPQRSNVHSEKSYSEPARHKPTSPSDCTTKLQKEARMIASRRKTHTDSLHHKSDLVSHESDLVSHESDLVSQDPTKLQASRSAIFHSPPHKKPLVITTRNTATHRIRYPKVLRRKQTDQKEGVQKRMHHHVKNAVPLMKSPKKPPRMIRKSPKVVAPIDSNEERAKSPNPKSFRSVMAEIRKQEQMKKKSTSKQPLNEGTRQSLNERVNHPLHEGLNEGMNERVNQPLNERTEKNLESLPRSSDSQILNNNHSIPDDKSQAKQVEPIYNHSVSDQPNDHRLNDYEPNDSDPDSLENENHQEHIQERSESSQTSPSDDENMSIDRHSDEENNSNDLHEATEKLRQDLHDEAEKIKNETKRMEEHVVTVKNIQGSLDDRREEQPMNEQHWDQDEAIMEDNSSTDEQSTEQTEQFNFIPKSTPPQLKNKTTFQDPDKPTESINNSVAIPPEGSRRMETQFIDDQKESHDSISRTNEAIQSLKHPLTIDVTHKRVQKLSETSIPDSPVVVPSGMKDCSLEDIVGEVIQDRFKILGIISKSSFSLVCKCHDRHRGQKVAIKFIPEYSNQHSELKIHQKLKKHFNCVHYSSFQQSFKFGSFLCIVMDLYSISIERLLSQENFDGISIDVLRSFARQLLECLSELRKAKIIHRGINPGNVLLSKGKGDCPELIVVGFGSAMISKTKKFPHRQILHYRSPEMLLGLKYGYSSDIWALGCLLAELVLGRSIFYGESELEVLYNIQIMLANELPQKMLAASPTPFVTKNPLDVNQYSLINSDLKYANITLKKCLVNDVSTEKLQLFRLLQKMLEFDPKQRITPQKALDHDFFLESKRDDWKT